MHTARVKLEVAAWTAVAIVAWATSAYFNVSNMLLDFVQRHEEWQLDELLTLVFLLGVVAFLVSLFQTRHHLRVRLAAEADAFAAARLDDLTGLPNRKMFLELAGQSLGEAWRSESKCSVLFVDLDGFKPVNDTYGHAAGDALLIALATRLQETMPANSIVARLGGDEFAILLPNLGKNERSVLAAAKGILASLQEPYEISGREISVGASIGVAIGPDSGKRAEDLTDAADQAMYEAKRSGRGAIRIARPAPAPGRAERPEAAEQGSSNVIFIQTPVMASPASASSH
jgi:diguanylate cyclase (GGDEF)-like protein